MSRAKANQADEPPDTRTRILDAARQLIEARGYHGAGLDRIARAAGVSRQAIYLHFGSKGGLMQELVEHVDRVEGLNELVRPVMQAADPITRLKLAAELYATYDPRIVALARALISARQTDPDAEAAWQNRMRARHEFAKRVVRELAEAGELAEGWTQSDAADLLWAVTSPAVLELLQERGWTPKRHARALKRLLLGAFTIRNQGR